MSKWLIKNEKDGTVLALIPAASSSRETARASL